MLDHQLWNRIGVSSGAGTCEDGVDWAAGHGLRHIELACQHPANQPHTFDRARTAGLRRRLTDAGLHPVVHSASAANTAETLPGLRDAVFTHLMGYLDLTAELGAEVLIVHAGHGFGADTTAARHAASGLLTRLATEAGARGVTLALENMNVLPPEAEIRYLGCTAADVAEYLDAAGSPALTYCADLGHANLLPGGVPVFLAAAGDRIGHVQITDNDGVIDDHLPLGAGTLPLTETLALLDRGPYRGPIAVELDSATDRSASLTAIRAALAG